MTRSRNEQKTSTMHRLGLTHGREGVPKFIRENTEQFFAAATRRKPKIGSASRPINSTELQQKQNNETNLFTTSISKPSTPITGLPPIRTASSIRRNAIPSASLSIYETPLPSFMPCPSNSVESSSPIIKSPPSKRQFRPTGPVDQDIFRKAYERALSVARSRLLFRDPYSLTRTSATHGVLYSYYDHTPMCVFSHGTACNHRQDKTNKQERKTKSDILRKNIFNDVIVEHYIR